MDRRPHRIGGDELIDDVLAGEPTHDEHDQADDDETDAERANLLPPAPTGQPDGGDKGGECEDPDEVRDLLEPVGERLGRVQIVCLEDRDLPGVRRDLVCEIGDEPEPIAQLEDERPDVEDDIAVRRVHRLRVAVQNLDELLLREHGEVDERVLDARPGEKVLRRRAHEALGEAGDRARERLEVRRQLGLERAREVDVRERIGHLSRHRLLDRRIGDELLRGLPELARVERLALDVRREDAEDQEEHAEHEQDAGGDDPATRGGVGCGGGGHGSCPL